MSRKKFKLYNYNYDHKYEKIEGTIGFFCRHCFKPHYFKIDNMYINNYRYYNNLMVDNKYKFICEECKYYNEWDEFIDPNILKSIALLNKKNYITYCCCEGHNYKYADAYILFKYKYDIIEKRIDLLKDWYITKKSYYITKDKVVVATEIRCNLDTSLYKRMRDLYKWVKNLPYNEEIVYEHSINF